MEERDQIQGDKNVSSYHTYGDHVEGDKVAGNKIVIKPAKRIEPPLQLPPRARFFQGRAELMEQVLAVLHPGRVVTLHGMGGIGKTAVTAEVAHTLFTTDEPSRFPDGLIFYSFYGRSATDLTLEHILHSLDLKRRGDLDDNVRAALGGKKLLLILDGAEEADHLSRVVELGATCAILISSRKQEDVFDARFAVKRLDGEDAERLLAAWAGLREDDGEIGREICAHLGNLPLALRLVGGYMAGRGMQAAEYLTWLRESSLEALDFGARREQSVRLLLAHSLDQVSETARQALAAAGQLALAPFELAAVAAALDQSIIKTQNALGELVNFGLLERPTDRYLISHPLVHTFARIEMTLEKEPLLRLAAYYVSFIKEESAKGAGGFRELDHERPHILQLTKVCRQRQAWGVVSQLVWAVDGYLDHQGHGANRITALEEGIHAAQALGSRRDEGALLGKLGTAYHSLGQVKKAMGLYQEALDIARETGNRRDEGAWLGNLGLAKVDRGEVEGAMGDFQQALDIARETSDQRNEGAWVGNLGLANAYLGQEKKAIKNYKQALVIARKEGDQRSAGIWLGRMGHAYRNQGRTDKAIKKYQQALIIARKKGDRPSEGAWLDSLGSVYAGLGKGDEAVKNYQQALVIAQETSNRRQEGALIGNLGSAYASRGQVDEATGFYQQALDIAQEVKDRPGEGTWLGALGSAYAHLGQVEKGRVYLGRALDVFEAINDPRAEMARRQLADLSP